MRKIPISQTAAAPCTKSVLVQWFPQWWGWYSSTASNDDKSVSNSSDNSTSIKSELEDEILDALGDTFENNTLLKRDVVFGQFNFTLKQGVFNLCSTVDPTAERYLKKIHQIMKKFTPVNNNFH